MFLHSGNGGAVNGSVINGRGLRHRRLPREQLIGLAAEVASGEKQFEPSLGQLCDAFDIRPAELRAELKERAEQSSADRIERVLNAFAAAMAAFRSCTEGERKLAQQIIDERYFHRT